MDFVSLVMDTVGGWISMAFELANDAVLQEWADEVIRDTAYHTEDLIKDELSTRPDLLSDVDI